MEMESMHNLHWHSYQNLVSLAKCSMRRKEGGQQHTQQYIWMCMHMYCTHTHTKNTQTHTHTHANTHTPTDTGIHTQTQTHVPPHTFFVSAYQRSICIDYGYTKKINNRQYFEIWVVNILHCKPNRFNRFFRESYLRLILSRDELPEYDFGGSICDAVCFTLWLVAAKLDIYI